MTRNLVYYCRQGVEFLQIQNANLAVYPIRFEHVIVQSANRIPYDLF